MYLEKIELQGFKSFAPKTTIKFDRGITAVVGPNGSGKSNVADAVRWVTGEQSMKTLRGKKSDDVIFAGSQRKARLGMAEVSLHLNNEDGRMPIDYSQVVVTRRLYRNGDGEYLLNKSKVRLLDIQELLAKSGFGQKTYSVIGQGMVDAVLRAGPKERREMFEEAAGIKHFQLKRNTSINKLERTKRNLIRVGDLLAEIEPRRNSLKRQANKAQKKDQVQQDLQTLQLEYFNHLWNEISQRYQEAQVEFSKYDQQEQKVSQEIGQLKTTLDKADQAADYSQEDEIRERLNDLVSEKNQLQEDLAVVTGRIKVEQEKDSAADVRELNHNQENLEGEISQYRQQVATLEKDKQIVQDKLTKSQSELEKISQGVAELEKKLRDWQVKAVATSQGDIQEELKTIYNKQRSFLEELEACDSLEGLDRLRETARAWREDFSRVLKMFDQGEDSQSEQNNIAETQQKIENLIVQKKALENEVNDSNVQLAVKTSKLDDLQILIETKAKELTVITEKISQTVKGEQQPSLALDKYLAEQGKLQSDLEKIEGGIKETNNLIIAERKKVRVQRQEIFELEQTYRQQQEELNTVRQAKSASEVKKVKIASEREILIDEIKDNTVGQEFTELTAEFKNSPVAIDRSRADEIKVKIDKLRKQLIKIGEIDPAVVQEFVECDERYTFLSEQKEDLEKAIQSLQKIIAELDQTINEKFDLAFKNINEQFQKYFEVLFGGGKARLIKNKVAVSAEIDPESGIEEGSVKGNGQDTGSIKKPQTEEVIDIKATPPGKKLRGLSMLSGGEKALISIALLFAIITNKPTPFVILDEVDAALDESNTGRYADIISSLADKSQFIIITHNRETMRRAKLMYGVTMEESGISKLLSMKLDKLPN